MIRLLNLAAFLFIFVSVFSSFAGPVDSYGNLQVKFSSTYNSMTLCDKNGNPVQLRGMSSMGLQWYPWGQSPWGTGNPDTKAVPKLAGDWGATVVRAAMYVGEGGYIGNETTMTNKVKSIVDAAITAGIYVIIDWHVLGGGTENPKNNQAQAEAFFAGMSALYGNKPNVIWEICNEPNGATTWANIKEYATGWGSNIGAINAIRNNDPDNATNKNIIIVGTPNWSQKVWLANGDPISLPNIMYAFHFYASSRYHVFDDSPEWVGIPELAPNCTGVDDGNPATLDGDGIGRAADVVLSKGNIAIFVTEWGVCEETGNGVFDVAKTDYYVNWMAQRNISWTNWSLCNKGETASALAGSGTGESGWNDATDLSASGTYVKGKILGNGATNPPTAVPTAAPTQGPTAVPTAVPTQGPTSVPTAVPTSGPTNPPTGGLYPCDGNCASRTLIAPEFIKEGIGEFCFEATSMGDYINSWNMDSLELNGVNIKNTYIASGSYPAAINGKYYLYYKSTATSSHIEIKGQGATAAPTSVPTAVPTQAPTAVPTAVPTQGPTSVPTAVPTAAPTQAPTAVPTTAPTAAPGACTTVTAGNVTFNTAGAFCFQTQQQIAGWGASNCDGRTVSVTINGSGTAVTTVGGALPAKNAADYYVFQWSAGNFSYASTYWW
jgi:aryl-phospho-beta-D-glucosidase BglC (GH1 family)